MGDFARKLFFRDKEVVVIHNGTDIEAFKAKNVTKPQKDTYGILAIASDWNAKKGLNNIFKLIEILAEEHHITMVGLTEDQVKSRPAGLLGVLRTKTVQELVALYNDSDVLINPAYADNFPTINIEALSCGNPVVPKKQEALLMQLTRKQAS